MKQETRVYDLQLETRHDPDRPLADIIGYAAVFHSRSVDLGGFTEEIESGAFTTTLATGPDVRATIDHAGGLSTIGRTTNGTLTLQEDDRGLMVIIRPPDTTAGRDVLELVKRGDISQMSFKFRVPTGGDEWTRAENGQPLRRLKVIDLADGDVALVTYPAYPATTAEARAAAAALSEEGEAAASQAAVDADNPGDNGTRARLTNRRRKIKVINWRNRK